MTAEASRSEVPAKRRNSTSSRTNLALACLNRIRLGSAPRAFSSLVRRLLSRMVEKDIWESAATMIDLHGENAALEAGLIGDGLLDKGDVEGQRAWICVVIAIEELQNPAPNGKGP